jgi:hypothetical protein
LEGGKFVNANPREKAAIAFKHGAKAIFLFLSPTIKHLKTDRKRY